MSKETITVQMNKEFYESVIGNVPQEGGGSNFEYLDLSGVDYIIDGQIPIKSILGSCAYSTKFVNPNNDLLIIACCASLYTSYDITAI